MTTTPLDPSRVAAGEAAVTSREGFDLDLMACAVAASAEGYAFPTNLDRDIPIGGLTPPSQQDLVHAALANKAPPDELAAQLTAHRHRRATH